MSDYHRTIRENAYKRYVEALEVMPEYLSGEGIDIHRAAEVFGLKRETAGKVLRYLCEGGKLTRSRECGHDAYLYRKAPANQMCRGWGVRNDIPIGRYYGYVPVTLESIAARHA